MGTKDIIGHINCPVCDHDMPVKEDKNGHAYGHCAHRCNAQVFTRNEHRNSLLRQRMRAVTVTVTEPGEKAPEPLTVPVFVPPAPAPVPASKPAPAPAPATKAPAAPVKADPKPKANWFTPIMGGAKHGRA